jgi:biotin operon repressor
VSAAKIGVWVRFLHGFIDESCRLSRETANLPTLKGTQAKLMNLIAENDQSADFLRESLNLLPHSLRAAISYLRRAGVGIECARRNGQTIYRLAQGTAQIADSLFSGIDESIRNFYSNRAAALA